MAVKILEQGIMPRRGNPASRPVEASAPRAELERDALSALISGMNRDAHLLGDVLDICPDVTRIVRKPRSTGTEAVFLRFEKALTALREDREWAAQHAGRRSVPPAGAASKAPGPNVFDERRNA